MPKQGGRKPQRDEYGYISAYRAEQERLAKSGYTKTPKSQVTGKNMENWEKANRAAQFVKDFRAKKGSR